MIQQLRDKLAEISDDDARKSEEGSGAAGTRVRKVLSEIQKMAGEYRRKIMDWRKENQARNKQ